MFPQAWLVPTSSSSTRTKETAMIETITVEYRYHFHYRENLRHSNIKQIAETCKASISWPERAVLDFVCLFVCLGFFVPHENNFHSYGDVILTDEGMQILTYTRQIWPLSSEGSLAFHTYCDTVHPFIMVIRPVNPLHSNLLPSVLQWSCNYLYLRLRSVAVGIRTPNLPLAGPTL